MKIAVPIENGKIYEHYGRTPMFLLYNVEDGKILEKQSLPTDGRGHYYMVQFLVVNHVDTVLCKSCGSPAQSALKIAGIRLELGYEGDPDEAVKHFLS